MWRATIDAAAMHRADRSTVNALEDALAGARYMKLVDAYGTHEFIGDGYVPRALWNFPGVKIERTAGRHEPAPKPSVILTFVVTFLLLVAVSATFMLIAG